GPVIPCQSKCCGFVTSGDVDFRPRPMRIDKQRLRRVVCIASMRSLRSLLSARSRAVSSRIRVTNGFVMSDMSVPRLGRSSAGCLGEGLEEASPVAFRVKDAAHLITTRPVKIQTAMLELDARSVLA